MTKKEIKKRAKEEIKKLNIVVNAVNYIPNKNLIELKSMGRVLVKNKSNDFVILLSEGVVYAKKGEKCNINLRTVIKEITQVFGGGFGERNNEFSGGGPSREKTKHVYELAKKLIKKTKKNR